MKQNVIAYCKFNNFCQLEDINTDTQQAFSKPVLESCWIHFVFPNSDDSVCLIMLGTETDIDKFATHVMSLMEVVPNDKTIEGVMKNITEGVSTILSNYFENKLNLNSMFCD
jgi:hypothetical protein